MRERNLRSMEMKRRTFIKTFITTGSLVLVGGLNALAAIKPVKKILYALKLKKYPGKIKPMGKITQSDELLG